MHDYFQYYWLYKDFDPSRVIAPHNMRLVGAFFVFLFYKFNIFYDTVSAADKYQTWGFLKQVYFDALLFNYVSVAATCTILFQVLNKQFQHSLFSFFGATLYLLGFGTIFYELMPGVDAFSVLLFVLALRWYFDSSHLIFIPIVLLVFQREYLLIVISTVAIMDYWKVRQAYFFKVGLAAAIFFVLHVILRKTIFYTPHLDFQSSGDFFLSNLFQLNYSLADYFKQLLLTLNLFILYVGLLLYKKYHSLPISQFNAWKLILLFLQINIITHLAGHGNNCGRYFYMVTPLIIYYLMQELFPMLKQSAVNSK